MRFRFKHSINELSISAKTLISHVTLALVVVLLANVLSYFLTIQYVRDTRIRDLSRKAGRIAASVHSVSEGELRPNKYLVGTYQDLTDAKVFFLDVTVDPLRVWHLRDPAAEISEGEEFQWVDIISAIDRKFIMRILDGETVTALQSFDFTNGKVLFAGVPILSPDHTVIGGVILAQPAEQLQELSRTIRLVMVVVIGASLLLAVLLAMLLTSVLVRPIQRITRAARRMTDGTYAERISPLPNDEIGDLGRAMNSMSARLIDVIRNLRKERDKLELVITGIREGLIAVDYNWRIVHYNPIFLELIEQDSIEDIWDVEDDGIARLRDMLERCMQSGETEHIEWVNPSKRALYAAASDLTDESGEILGAVCLVRDVSEVVRMEQLRRDYVANISHELRTPLTGIRGMVEPLIDGCMDTEEERQDSYRVILKETIRLEKLVGEMLDMSRLQDGRVSVELEQLELPGILEAAVRSMQSIAEGAGVTLAIETDGSELACIGNEDRITQVLVILMDNALSFTPSGGTVTVFARDEGEKVALGVRDTGCGIEPKDLPLIWERFYKADKSRMRTTGTGLGLSIAKLVVELMGGEIHVQSEPGKGAEFTFTLNK
ncbi:MAG: HAMP domain-containing protein [Clostridia bacterium]|nr:HAMP domain-containing protein [Clostridia bacterium]